MSKKQVVDEIHKPARKHFQRRKVIIKGIDELFQADLVDMLTYANQNRGFKYMLTVIDTFSKYAWTIPIKDKSGKSVANAMQKVFDQGRICKNLQTDDGTDFFNKDFAALTKKYKINHYSVYTSLKAGIVERFNRTIKSNMWKEFSLNGNYCWINIIERLCNDYNNRIHRTIKMKPVEVTKTDEKKLLSTVYKIDDARPFKTKFHVGDHVRISKYKHVFEKSYTPNWSTECFKVTKVFYTNPETYNIIDSLGHPIKGRFYKYELLKVKNPDVYLVEKILKRKGQKVYVRWLGLGDEHNSWIDKKNVL